MVFEKVREIICDQLDLADHEVTMDSRVMDDLDADSLDLRDIVSSIEEEFDVSIPEAEIDHIRTVGELVAYIEARM